MGYELRLHVGEYHVYDDRVYFLEIGQLDLCKVGMGELVIENDPDAINCFIWASDGNTQLTEDDHGDPIRAIPLKAAILKLKRLVKVADPYRRYVIALAMLKAIDDTFIEDEDVYVAFYGY